MATTCSKCGKPGHNARSCGREAKGRAHTPKTKETAKSKKPTGGGTRRSTKSKPAKVAAVRETAADNGYVGSVAARIRGLVQAVAAGKSAEAELTAIREALEAE